MNQVFRSGRWQGFYLYAPDGVQHRMTLHLTFHQGRVLGDGVDDIGVFEISGRYDEAEQNVAWTKSYPGSHQVRYDGCLDNHGIWGVWDIPSHCRGGFHIWPAEMSEHQTQEESEEDRTRRPESGLPSEVTHCPRSRKTHIDHR